MLWLWNSGIDVETQDHIRAGAVDIIRKKGVIKTAEGEGEEDALFQVFTGGPFAFVYQLNKLYKGLHI